MTKQQEQQLIQLIDRLGHEVVKATKTRGVDVYRNIGAMEYLIWEARVLLKLPEIDGLKPI